MQELKLVPLDGFEETLREEIKDIFNSGESIAVKVHMGEIDNPYYIKPEIIKKVVDVCLSLELKPFLFDSVVLYKGARDTVEKYLDTAEKHGFTSEIGCPIVISDTGVDVQTKDMVVHVCKEFVADGLLDISHGKGHMCYGFGGAIKNLGMGGVTPESKKDIHSGALADTDDLLAQAAGAVLGRFKKAYFVNFLINISKNCDCANDAGPILVEDIGVLMGKDMVALDKASVDLIYKEKPGILEKEHNKDPYLHIKYAASLGLGEEEYIVSK